MSESSKNSAIITLVGAALLILVAAGAIFWLFTRPAPVTSSDGPTPTELPEGVYSIDDQLDKL